MIGFSGVPFSVSDIVPSKGVIMRVDVVQPLGLVEPGMHQDRVARLCPPLPDDAPVAQPGAVVGLQEAREAGLLARALIVRGVDVQRTPFLGGLRLAAGLHPHGVLGLATRPVRIGQPEPALIFRPRLQIEDAAGESVGDRVVEILAPPVDVLAADSDQGQRLSPAGFADRPELHRDRRIPIRIPADLPLEAQVQERGVLDDEPPRLRAVLGVGPHRDQEERQETSDTSWLGSPTRLFPFRPERRQAYTRPPPECNAAERWYCPADRGEHLCSTSSP